MYLVCKVSLESECNAGSIVKNLIQPILSSFAFDITSSYKLFKTSRSIHNGKMNRSFPRRITFCYQDDEKNRVYFNGEILSIRILFWLIFQLRYSSQHFFVLRRRILEPRFFFEHRRQKRMLALTGSEVYNCVFEKN